MPQFLQGYFCWRVPRLARGVIAAPYNIHCALHNACGTSPGAQPSAKSHSLSLTDKPEWFSELPYFWTKVQVLEWISYHVEKNKYDASSIDFSCCNMDGHALCHCTRDQMRLIFGPLGDELYDRLHEISECPHVPSVLRSGSSQGEAKSPMPAQGGGAEEGPDRAGLCSPPC